MTTDRIGATFEARVGEIVAEVQTKVRLSLDGSAPTIDFLRKLGDALLAASRDPSRGHEADPDRMWRDVLWPRSVTTVDATVASIDAGRDRVDHAVRELEAVLEDVVRQRILGAAEQGVAASGDLRTETIDELAVRLDSAHRSLESFTGCVPTTTAIDGVEQALTDHRRRQATDDVRKQKRAWLAAAGGDAQHQRIAELQWESSVEERVAHRDAQLRGELPWRHQELAIAAHRQAIEMVREKAAAIAEASTAPLLAIGERLVGLYDDLSR